MSGIDIMVSDRYGIYIPQIFVNKYNIEEWDNVSGDDWEIVREGPNHEWYWEAWQAITENATCSHEGNTWRLFQDGDLWAYCPELMTAEEHAEFFGEPIHDAED